MLGLLYRALIYFLPVLMTGIERQLNEVAKRPEAATLFAPSLAAAAIGLFMPTAKPSSTSPEGWKKTTDRWFTAVGLAGVLLGLYLWHMLVAVNLGAVMDDWVPTLNLMRLGVGGSIATLAYAVAVLLTEAKTAVER